MKFLFIYIACILFQPAFSSQNDSLLFERADLRIYNTTALAGGKVIYDAIADRHKLIEEDSCGILTKVIYTPLSLTGNFYAYEKAVIETGSPQCGNPASMADIVVIDIRTRGAASILDLVNESSLVVALKNDGWVKKLHIPEQEMAESKTLAKLLATINGHVDDGIRNQFTPSQFAVTRYDANTNKLFVRLIKKEYRGFNHYTFLQLGLSVKPNDELVSQINTTNGFYLGKFKGVILTR